MSTIPVSKLESQQAYQSYLPIVHVNTGECYDCGEEIPDCELDSDNLCDSCRRNRSHSFLNYDWRK